MKRTFLVLLLAAVQTAAWAIPAKRGQWKTVTLEDGTTVRVELRGDERIHYWQAADGRRFIRHDERDCYVPADIDKMRQAAETQLSAAPLRSPSRVTLGGDHQPYQGSKKGLIVLAEFTDKKFQPGHDAAFYSRVANEPGFTSADGFVGSIHDYFHDQSNGQFDLTFDVVGPIQLANNMAYYGGPTTYGHDKNVAAMIREAAQGAANILGDFAPYDWFGDGKVDQVFVIYAGLGEATGGDENTIWPHRSEITQMTLAGRRVNVYACTNEMTNATQIAGIGTFCHEFSHCLGLADLYDTSYSGNYGMGTWDIMDSGGYLGNGFRPCNYSGFERNYLGWAEPVELTADTDVQNLKGLADGGECYIVYNDAYKNEYFMLENRTRSGWDKELYGSGLLITHIDFSTTLWAYNKVNTTNNNYPVNDHQRFTLFLADNATQTSTVSDIAGDLYPYKSNNRLTNTTVPAATLYHANTVGEMLMSKPITRIVKNSDNTVSFTFRNMVGKSDEKPEGVLFSETFEDACGTGGNDGRWDGTGVGAGSFVADNDGWTSTNKYAGDRCARFGTKTQRASVTTPAIAVSGETVLSFLAAPWTGEATQLTLNVTSGSATLSKTTFTLYPGQWRECKAVVKGEGNIKVQIRADKGRIFLDEVFVKTLDADAVEAVDAAQRPTATYNLMGQRIDGRAKGLVIRNGRKTINR